MTALSPEAREHLAGQYVLGTLQGAARRRVERLMTEDFALRRAVEDWERRLGGLAETAPPVAPPASLWRGIEARTRPAPRTVRVPMWSRLGLWRNLGLAASAAAAGLVIYIAVALWPGAAPGSGHIALIEGADNVPAWLARVDLENRELRLESLRVDRPGSDKSYELWLILPDGSPPRSLGLAPATGSRTLTLSQAVRAPLPEGVVLAVSLEAAGGSDTGLPQGPVLFQGILHRPQG